MGGALACCTKLRELNLEVMGADDAAMAAFGGALGGGAAPALKEARLYDNKIGGEGAVPPGRPGVWRRRSARARDAWPQIEQYRRRSAPTRRRPRARRRARAREAQPHEHDGSYAAKQGWSSRSRTASGVCSRRRRRRRRRRRPRRRRRHGARRRRARGPPTRRSTRRRLMAAHFHGQAASPSSCCRRRAARPLAPTFGCSRHASSSRTSTAAGGWRSGR